MAVAGADAPTRMVPVRRGSVRGAMRLSPDGRLLVILLAVTLLGPYFPLFDWLGRPGFTVREVRVDNLLLPAVAAYIVVRSLATGVLRTPMHVVLYGTFCAWLLLVTVLWAGNIPTVYGVTSDPAALLQGGDAYIRPLLMLFITANVRVTRHDLMVIIRLILVVAVLLALVAAAQFTPITQDYVNPFLADHYDNSGSERYFWAVLNQGRVAALMPQLSTLGMYMVLVLGIVGAQFLGAALVRSKVLLAVLVASALAGGILCGSKVFTGGLLLTAALTVFLWRRPPRWNVANLLATVAAGVAVWIVVATFFPTQADTFRGRIPSSGGGFYRQYIASRFEPESGKVYRTGAVDIASKYPLSGLGLNVVGNTTDSLLLGVLVMSGAMGGALYLGTVCVVGLRLHAVSRSVRDPTVAGLARMMLVLTVVFLVTAIGFHTFIQDRAGDAYWMVVGLLLAPMISSPRGERTRDPSRPNRVHPGPSAHNTAQRVSEGSIGVPRDAPTTEPRLRSSRALDVSAQCSAPRRLAPPGYVQATSHGNSRG